MNKYWNYTKDEFSNRSIDKIPYFLDEGYNYIKQCKKILDIGCGIGNVVEFLNNNNHKAVGLTYNEDEYNEAKRLNRNVVLEDMNNIKKLKPGFNAVIIWDVLEHSISPLITLLESYKMLTNNGLCLIYIPPEEWIETKYHIIVPNNRQMFHLISLTKYKIKDIKLKVRESGIYILEKVEDEVDG